jgi:hypothetical protein
MLVFQGPGLERYDQNMISRCAQTCYLLLYSGLKTQRHLGMFFMSLIIYTITKNCLKMFQATISNVPRNQSQSISFNISYLMRYLDYKFQLISLKKKKKKVARSFSNFYLHSLS